MYIIQKTTSDKEGEEKVVKDIHLYCNEDAGKLYKKVMEEDEGFDKEEECHKGRIPFHQFKVTRKDFDEHTEDNRCVIAPDQTTIYDKTGTTKLTYKNLHINSCQDIHQSMLYTINNASLAEAHEVSTDHAAIPDEAHRKSTQEWKVSYPGLYVYDIERFFEGSVEKYKLSSLIGG